MQKFIKKIILFIALLIFSFFLIVIFNGYLLYLLDKSFKGKSNAHILLIGDSNMECAVNDSIYKGSINLSKASDSYFYSYLKLKAYISQNQNIDTIFLSFSPHNIFDNGWLLDDSHIYSRFRLYYPLMDWSDFYFLFSRNSKAIISSFPSIINQTIKNFIKLVLGKTITSYGGYQSLDRDILEEVKLKLLNGEPLPFFKIPNNFKISKEEVTYLNKIIDLCQRNKIKLYLVNLPKRIELLNYKKYGVTEFNKYYDSFFKNVDFLDFSNFKMPDSYYGDFVHLNKKGSTYFSEFLEKNKMMIIEQNYKREKARTHNILYK